MKLLAALLLLSGAFPLAKALRANRATTLWQPLLWAFSAWSVWTAVAWLRLLRPGEWERLTAYGALCLTSCAGIAVLGARRPGASAWNFVVAGLLAVLLLPILNGMGELRLEPAQKLFLAGTLAVSVLNYLPTRLGLNAVVAAAGCGWEMMRLLGWIAPATSPWLGLFLLALTPWTVWTAVATWGAAPTEFDRLWLAYRDRFGFVWGQRMREQFNRAAHHAGWPVVLRWSGLQMTAVEPSPDPAELLAMLRAVLKRFGPDV
ncbi:MAG TPA: hypothetical protein VMF69_28255 [Gemmataceae bacterium]|nr:hypothetical protein [Gemmataceae bacterium]